MDFEIWVVIMLLTLICLLLKNIRDILYDMNKTIKSVEEEEKFDSLELALKFRDRTLE